MSTRPSKRMQCFNDPITDPCCNKPPLPATVAADCAHCGLSKYDSSSDACSDCCCCFEPSDCVDESCSLASNHPQQPAAKTSAQEVVCASSHCELDSCDLQCCSSEAETSDCAECVSHTSACDKQDCCSSSSSTGSSTPLSETSPSLLQQGAQSAKFATAAQCHHGYDPESKVCHWGDDCAFSFTSTSDLDNHLRTSHISILDHQRLQNAIQQEARQRQLEARRLEQQRIQEEQIKQEHEKQQQQQRQLEAALLCQWDSCGMMTTELDALLSHIKSTHVVKADPTSSLMPPESNIPTTTSEFVECHWNQCSEPSVDTSGFDAHLVGHLATAPLQCEWDECDFTALTSGTLVSHVVHDHVPSEKAAAAVAYQQGMGGSIYSAHMLPQHHGSSHSHHSHHHDHAHGSHLHSHPHHSINTHDNINNINNIDNHISNNIINTDSNINDSTSNTPTEETEHRCCWLVSEDSVCAQIFASTRELSAHIVAEHVGSRKQEYTCFWKGCERNTRPFSQRQKIIRHLQIHTHDRPFECRVCGRRFADQGVLAQHERIHSGEKPFECKMCGKRFAASTALSVHLRIHTGEKPLQCKWPGCGRRFSESSNLAKHMKTHTNEKKYKCEVDGCGKEFLRHDQYIRHLKTHRNESEEGGCEGPRAHVKGMIKQEGTVVDGFGRTLQGRVNVYV